MKRSALLAVVACGLVALVAAGSDADAKDPTALSECVQDVVFNLNLGNLTCMKMLLVKFLGFAVIAGSFTYKVPQIKKLVDAGDATGVSLTSTYIELLCLGSVIMFHVLQGNPVSAWGENAVIAVQQVVLVYLLWKYKQCSAAHIAVVVAAFAAVAFVELNLTPQHQPYIFSATIPAFSAARIPQVWENFSNGHTGQLALITVFMGFAGSMARVFTSLAEVDDVQVAVSFVLAAMWNSILLLQILFYWGATQKFLDSAKEARAAAQAKKDS